MHLLKISEDMTKYTKEKALGPSLSATGRAFLSFILAYSLELSTFNLSC